MNGLLAALGAVATGTGLRVLPRPRARFEPDEPTDVELREESLEVAAPPIPTRSQQSMRPVANPPATAHEPPQPTPDPPIEKVVTGATRATETATSTPVSRARYVVAENTIETIMERVEVPPPPLGDTQDADASPSPAVTVTPQGPPPPEPPAQPTAVESISALIRWIEADEADEADEAVPTLTDSIPAAAGEPLPPTQLAAPTDSPSSTTQPLSAAAGTPAAFAELDTAEPLAPVINVAIDRLVVRQSPQARPANSDSEGLRFAGPTLAEFLGERP